jgi:hypothetical protein
VRHVARNVGQHLAALIIEAQRHRRAGEACAMQVREIRLNGRGEGPGRPSYGVADPDNSGGRVTPGERDSPSVLPAMPGLPLLVQRTRYPTTFVAPGY